MTDWIIEFDGTGLAEEAIAEHVRAKVAEVSESIRAEAEANAPQEERNRIGKSVKVEPFTSDGWEGLGAEIGTSGPNAWLGHIHEFGTVKMPAHPFLGPAGERHAAPAAVAVEQGVADGLAKVTR